MKESESRKVGVDPSSSLACMRELLSDSLSGLAEHGCCITKNCLFLGILLRDGTQLLFSMHKNINWETENKMQ